MPKPIPTFDRVRELFNYDEASGDLTWKQGTSFHDEGATAGWDEGRGYRKVYIDGLIYYGHHVVWLWMTGVWQPMLDHEDLDKSNLRWRNLRPANKSLNSVNRGLRADNKSGRKGVHWDASRGKWVAQIRYDGKHIFIGRFLEKEDAYAAYAAKSRELWPDFSRLAA